MRGTLELKSLVRAWVLVGAGVVAFMVTTTTRAQAPTPPAAPSNLVAARGGQTQISLRWNDNSTNETGFRIERCQGAGCTNFAREADVPFPNITNAVDVGLLAGTTYRYRVRALIGTGAAAIASDPSNVAQATTDPPTMSINDVSADEGNSGQTAFTFTVTLSNASSSTVTVDYRTTSGSATVGSDFNPAADRLTFTPGQTSKSVAVQVIGDTAPESNETFTVDLTNATNIAATGNKLQGLGTIQNDDAALPGPPTAPANLDAVPAGETQINLFWQDNSSDETGFKIERCQGVSCTNFAQIATVPANTTTAENIGLQPGTTYRYRVRAYKTVGGDSAYTNVASATTGSPPPSPQCSDGADNDGDGRLDTNDPGCESTADNSESPDPTPPPATPPTISVNDVSGIEGNSGTKTFEFNVTLSHAFDQDILVTWQARSGSASSGADFTASGPPLLFSAGETVEKILVTVTSDTATEPDEDFTIELVDTSRGTFADKTGKGTILNDDGGLAVNDPTTNEGQPVTFTVTLSPALAHAVTVQYATADGPDWPNATSGADFAPASGTITFQPGETSKTVVVTTVDDVPSEANERFVINLSNASGAAIVKARGTATIFDNDSGVDPPRTNDNVITTAPFTFVGQNLPNTSDPPSSVLQPRSSTRPTGPTMVIATTAVTVRGSTVTIRLACPATAANGCAGSAKIQSVLSKRALAAKAKPAVYGTARFNLRRGVAGSVKIKLSSKAMRLLRRARLLRTQVVVVAKSGTSPTRTTTGLLTLRLPAPKAKPVSITLDVP